MKFFIFSFRFLVLSILVGNTCKDYGADMMVDNQILALIYNSQKTYVADYRGDSVLVSAYNPQKTLRATGSNWGTVNVYSVSNGQQTLVKSFKDCHGKGSQISSLVFDPEGKFFVTGGWDEAVDIYAVTEKPENIERSKRVENAGREISSIVFNPQKKIFATGARNDDVHVYGYSDRENIEQIARFKGHWPPELIFNNQGTLFAFIGKNEVNLYDCSDVQNITLVACLKVDLAASHNRFLAFDSKGEKFAVASEVNKAINSYDVSNPQKIVKLSSSRMEIFPEKVSSDSLTFDFWGRACLQDEEGNVYTSSWFLPPLRRVYKEARDQHNLTYGEVIKIKIGKETFYYTTCRCEPRWIKDDLTSFILLCSKSDQFRDTNGTYCTHTKSNLAIPYLHGRLFGYRKRFNELEKKYLEQKNKPAEKVEPSKKELELIAAHKDSYNTCGRQASFTYEE